MTIFFTDFYYNNLSSKTLTEIKLFLLKQKLPKNKLDIFLISLKKNLESKYNIKIDFPYYHYYPNEVYKKEEILIDVSINDKYTWEQNLKKNKQNTKFKIPKNLKYLLKKYNNLLDKKQPQILFETGYYRTENNDTKKIEEKFLIKVDKNFSLLKSVLLNSFSYQDRIDAAFFLGYAVKKEKLAIDLLKKVGINDLDHSVHNMVARSLFPKILNKKVDVLDLEHLFYHHNPYCQNKILGTFISISLDVKTRKKLKTIKQEVKKRTKNFQGIVSYVAKELIKKI